MRKILSFIFVAILITGVIYAQDTRTVNLHWNSNPESNIAGYHMYRSENGGETFYQISDQLIPHIGAGTESFLDIDAEVGETYFYTCRAMNIYGLISDRSNIVSITIEATAPAPPTGLTVVIE